MAPEQARGKSIDKRVDIWDRIVYTPNHSEGLWTIPAGGGEARALTTVDRAAGEPSHRWPHVLPDGAGVLFTIKLATNESLDDARIAIADAETGAHHVLVEGGSMPRTLDSGELVFARAGRLYAVALDLAARGIRGAPVPVLDGVVTAPTTGAAWYDVTPRGELVYLTGGRVETNAESCPTASAGGTLVAYQSNESGRDEVYLARLGDPGSRRKLTNEGATAPLWSRDGTRLFFIGAEGVLSMALLSAADLRLGAPELASGPRTLGEIVGYDVAVEGSTILVERTADRLMLRRDLRLWPAWGEAVRSGE